VPTVINLIRLILPLAIIVAVLLFVRKRAKRKKKSDIIEVKPIEVKDSVDKGEG
jgi:preprotein translocase subunit YajC